MPSSIVGRIACHVDALGSRTGCEVLRTIGDQVEVKGRGAAVGQLWVCSVASLEVIPLEWLKRWPETYR